MIYRYYREGEKLDVAGLNEITVLIDRSETEITEIGWNCWCPKLDGPPHRHGDKDQIFYVTDGEGIVKLGATAHPVRPGMLAYVPAGLVHQTITTSDEPLCYILFNVFRSRQKEGHATFADHIEKVKMIRKKQAEGGQVEVEDREEKVQHVLPAKFFEDLRGGRVFDSGINRTTLLLDRTETNRLELVLVSWQSGSRGELLSDGDMEQTVFVLEGRGTLQAGEDRAELEPGNLLFIPRGESGMIETGKENLRYLCLNALPAVGHDRTFEEMYNRLISSKDGV